MQEHPLNELMTSALEKIRTMADANTVVGQPIVTDDVTIIPVSRVSLGVGVGGSDFASKHQKPDAANAFGGGSGAGMSMDPMGFLIVRGDNVRLLPILPPATGAVDRAVELLPELMDKLTDYLDQRREKKDTEGF